MFALCLLLVLGVGVVCACSDPVWNAQTGFW